MPKQSKKPRAGAGNWEQARESAVQECGKLTEDVRNNLLKLFLYLSDNAKNEEAANFLQATMRLSRTHVANALSQLNFAEVLADIWRPYYERGLSFMSFVNRFHRESKNDHVLAAKVQEKMDVYMGRGFAQGIENRFNEEVIVEGSLVNRSAKMWKFIIDNIDNPDTPKLKDKLESAKYSFERCGITIDDVVRAKDGRIIDFLIESWPFTRLSFDEFLMELNASLYEDINILMEIYGNDGLEEGRNIPVGAPI